MYSIYLLHFERKHFHAQHYVGISSKMAEMIEDHRLGVSKCKLMQTIHRERIGFTLARVWKDVGDYSTARLIEKKIKRRKNTKKLCAFCSGAGSLRRASTFNLETA